MTEIRTDSDVEGVVDVALNLALRMSRDAGEIMLKYFRKPIDVEWKASDSPVTIADREAEELIRAGIMESFPDHDILGEEFSPRERDSSFWWCIDPIDGTRNYLHGAPDFCVSIGLFHDGMPVMGVVYDPLRDQAFSAAVGKGAAINQSSIRTATREECDLTVVGIQSAYSDSMPDYIETIITKGNCRNIGSASLQLCYVAAGFYDCFIGEKCYLWDIAGGAAILAEAGGEFRYQDGQDFFPLTESVSSYADRPFRFLCSRPGVEWSAMADFLGKGK